MFVGRYSDASSGAGGRDAARRRDQRRNPAGIGCPAGERRRSGFARREDSRSASRSFCGAIIRHCAGPASTTILHLADNANCPVIILGEPVNNPTTYRQAFARERICLLTATATISNANSGGPGEGSEIRNNGITVQNVRDSTVEHVTCARCRSGGPGHHAGRAAADGAGFDRVRQ